MVKKVDNKSFEEAVAKTGCAILSYDTPLTQFSNVSIKCSCGREFAKSRQSVRNIVNRPVRTMGGLSCGCIDKKWTNVKIDQLVAPKQIKRLTNCDVPGLRPSTDKLDWECLACNHQWKVAVDSLSSKNVGCPRCAGNLAYTIPTLQRKLIDKNRTDLVVLDITPGVRATVANAKQSPYGRFRCVACSNIWSADIHNVLKFGYGCPTCNDNISTRVYTPDGLFRSKLEHYFWETYNRVVGDTIGVLRQVRYTPERRFTCDFVLPDGKTWVEISGKQLLARPSYAKTIATKRQICESKTQIFVVLSSIPEINEFLHNLKEAL